MKLYLLEAGAGYDEYSGFVIRAKSPKAARKLAAEKCGEYTNGKDFLDPKKSTCTALSIEGEEEVIIDIGL